MLLPESEFGQNTKINLHLQWDQEISADPFKCQSLL